jgi:hypothetical protein
MEHKASIPVFSIYVPETTGETSKFFYDFYVADESVNPSPTLPDNVKILEETNINYNTNFSLRVPRSVSVSWNPPFLPTSLPILPIKDNLDKVCTEDSFCNSKYIPHFFSSVKEIKEASEDINGDGVLDFSTSQATNIDNYVNSILEKCNVSDQSEKDQLRKKIFSAVESIEKIADNPSRNLGYYFQDSNGKKISDTSGFDRAVSKAESVHMQINSSVLPDIFQNYFLSQQMKNDYNSFYKNWNGTGGLKANSTFLVPVAIDKNSPVIDTSYQLIGYIIDKYELTEGNVFVLVKTFAIEDPKSTKIVDTSIKYGSIYYYSIRSVVQVSTPAFDEATQSISQITYYVSSRPRVTSVVCEEKLPPPPPTDISFLWDYRKKKLSITWCMPSNPQRDIKQFQVFRRKAIDEPFELLRQIHFDFSKKLYQSRESVDGNKNDMMADERALVSYENQQLCRYVDEDFMADVDSFFSSKYIYALASVDAHGMVSCYSSQFEVYFDFFKNKIIKKFISESGAPRQYPNMRIKSDLFVDVMKVSGMSSATLKVYFTPEYFKINNKNMTTKLVSTDKDNGYYKLQFINVQNQKSDSVKIIVEDTKNLLK